MKKICVFILASMLLLGSCSPSGVVEDTAKTKGSESSVADNDEDAVDEFLTDLQFDVETVVAASTLDHIVDITSYKTREQTQDFISAPLIYTDTQYTYLLRRFPEDLITGEEFNSYVIGSERIHEIEIFDSEDFSAPSEVVTLAGMEGKKYSPFAFTYDGKKDVFYIAVNEKINDSYEPVFYTYSRAGEMMSRYEFTVNVMETNLCFDGKVFSIKNGGHSPMAADIVMIDPETDEKTKIDSNTLCSFTADGIFYYIKEHKTSDYRNIYLLCSYDPETAKTTSVMEINAEENITSAAYDSETEILYLTSTSKLYAYQDGESMEVLSLDSERIRISFLQDMRLFTQIGLNQISVYGLSEAPVSIAENQSVIRVCYSINDGGGLYQNILDRMNAAGIPVRFEDAYIASSNEEYVNNMAKKLLAGDTDFDIFYLTSEMINLYNENYFADLGAYDTLVQYYDKMIPGIKELSSINGKLALVPVNLRVNSMAYNSSLLTEFHKAPTSYKELFGLYNEITADLPDDYYYFGSSDGITLLEPWFDELASCYMSEIISDDTAEQSLTELFEDATRLNEYDRIFKGREYGSNRYLLENITNIGDPRVTDEAQIIALPKLGDSYKYSVNASFLAVNAKSPNKELVLSYLAYYLNDMMTSDYQLSAAYFNENEITVNPEKADSHYSAFKEQIADSIREVEVDGYIDHLFEMYKEINDGNLTPEEAASRTLRYLKMMRDE